MLEQEIPLHRIQASYDMGWQVRSSGHKYASPKGHALLIGTLTKKVLDSVVHNKKWGYVLHTTHGTVHMKMLRNIIVSVTTRGHQRPWRQQLWLKC